MLQHMKVERRKDWLRQALRGCRTLPHLGPHPGTPWLILLVVVGGLSGFVGRDPGLLPAIAGAGLMALVFGTLHLIGAVDRARASDRMEREREAAG